MNKIIDIIFKDMKKDKSIYVSLILVIIISFVFGLFFITILKDSDKSLVTEHINNYFDGIKSKEIIPSIYNNIINNNSFAIIMWILGFSIIGIPIIISMLFYKGFVLTFTITSLIFNFKLDGILLSFIYIFPHLILNLILYFIMSYYSFKLSLNLIGVITNKNKLNKNAIKKYLIILIITIVLLSLTALYETYIIPYLIKLIY